MPSKRTTAARPKKGARLEELAEQIRVCTLCPLCESRTLAVPGDGPSYPFACTNVKGAHDSASYPAMHGTHEHWSDAYPSMSQPRCRAI